MYITEAADHEKRISLISVYMGHSNLSVPIIRVNILFNSNIFFETCLYYPYLSHVCSPYNQLSYVGLMTTHMFFSLNKQNCFFFFFFFFCFLCFFVFFGFFFVCFFFLSRIRFINYLVGMTTQHVYQKDRP